MNGVKEEGKDAGLRCQYIMTKYSAAIITSNAMHKTNRMGDRYIVKNGEDRDGLLI